MSKERKIIKVPIPKEIWDADRSLCNIIMGRDNIVEAWVKSTLNIVKQCHTTWFKSAVKNTKICQNKPKSCPYSNHFINDFPKTK